MDFRGDRIILLMSRWIVLLIGLVFVMKTGPVMAQDTTIDNGSSISEEHALGRVVQILEEGTVPSASGEQPYQKLEVQLLSGTDKGQLVIIEHGLVVGIYQNQKVHQGEKVVMVKNTSSSDAQYFVTEKYRLPVLGWLAAIFLALVIFLGRMRGFASIVGLCLSIVILAKVVIPRIISGDNPLVVSILGAGAIILLSLYMAHGLNKRTHVSVISICITLLLAMGLSAVVVQLAHLSGLGSEEAFYLQLNSLIDINMQGLLLGGIIIGALGVLDDITTSQAAAVEELSEANTSLSVSELYKRGISIGTEHIASLVNTLALAYVGASFPLLLLFSTSFSQPIWVILNSEKVAEEIVRTLIGSLALVLAVPIVTYFSAVIFANDKARGTKRPAHGHHHHHHH